jgi:putative ABC transport system permease protein
MIAALLRLIPAEWRESVERDLAEENARAGRSRWRAHIWIAWQVLRVAIRFRCRPDRSVTLDGRWRGLMVNLSTDLRLAVRALRKQRGSSAAIVMTLALGIGATTAVYAVFNYMLFRPVPGVANADRLITVMFQPPNQPSTIGSASSAVVPAMRAHATGLEGLANRVGSTVAVGAPGLDPVFRSVQFIDAHYLPVLGVTTIVGRLLAPTEADVEGHDVAVISESFWRSTFESDPNVTGRTLTANGVTFNVVGVLRRFRGWGTTRVGQVDVWLPIAAARKVTGDEGYTSTLVGRLQPDASRAIVEQHLRRGYASLAETLPANQRRYVPVVYPGLQAFQMDSVRRSLLDIYWLVLGGAGLMLLLACANAANLLLARATARRRDTALRLAIGAGRWRIVRQFLVEATVLALVAGALGLTISILLTRVVGATPILAFLPPLGDVEIDRRVIGFCLAISTATVFAFGMAPAILGGRVDVHRTLHEGGRAGTASARLRSSLVAIQIAIALVLLSGAGVFARTLANLYSVNLGMDIDGVFELGLQPYRLGYEDTRSSRVIAAVMERLRAGGFDQVALSSPSPLETSFTNVTIGTPLTAKRVNLSAVSPDYFSVLRIPILAGRTFASGEFAGDFGGMPDPDPLPVIANAAMARELFGNGLALGQTFILTRSIGSRTASTRATIIGIVGDTRTQRVQRDPMPRLYSTGPSAFRLRSILVRPRAPEAGALTQIRQIVREVDPALPISFLAPLSQEIADALVEQRIVARMSGLVAVLAAVLAGTGIFALLSYIVGDRAREFGIRLALGATRHALGWQVLRRTVAICVVGLLGGVLLYAWTSQYVASRLYEVRPLDPLTLASAAAALMTAALCASWLPARRAAGVDPVITLGGHL